MLSALWNNLGTIVVGLAVAGMLAAIVAKIVRDKRKGRCAGCDCANCLHTSSCNTQQ